MKSSFRTTLGVLLAALLLGGFVCAVPAEAAPKDSVSVAISTEWRSLDPAIGNNLGDLNGIAQVYDTLVRQEKDGTYVPGLATEWQMSDDGTEYTFKLREGVKFHNGDTMTADDVVFSFDRSVASPATSRITGTIAKTEKIDDHTVKVTLKYPYGPFIGCTSAFNLGIVSKRAVEEGEATGEDFDFGRNPVGTGPYKLAQWVPGDRLIFEAFSDYFRGAPAIKSLTYRVIPDMTTQAIALEQGEIDMIAQLAPTEIPNISANDRLFLDSTPGSRFMFVAFNNAKGLFSNKLLRQAVSYAVDREATLLGGAEGVGTLVDAPMPRNCFGYPVDFKANPYDPEKARALIKEGGYNNELVTIRCEANTTFSRPVEIIMEQLRQVGFNVEIDMMETTAWLADVQTSGNYEITFTMMTALVSDADLITYTRFHSSMLGNAANFTYCNIPEMDEVLDRGRLASDPEERKAAYLRVSEIVRDEAVIVPFYSLMSTVAGDVNLKGLVANALQRVYIYDLHWEE